MYMVYEEKIKKEFYIRLLIELEYYRVIERKIFDYIRKEKILFE